MQTEIFRAKWHGALICFKILHQKKKKKGRQKKFGRILTIAELDLGYVKVHDTVLSTF